MALLGGTTVVVALTACGTAPNAVGEPAPLFVLETVVLNFWASWCVPCRTEMPEFDRFATAHPEVTVIGVAVEDTEEAARAFAAEVGVGYPLGLDDSIGDLYPRLGLPTTYVIRQGVVVSKSDGALTFADLEALTSP
jgi:thiol-disulfide isomerase/thioredoxin